MLPTTKLNRRNWLKSSALAMGAMALTPQELLAERTTQAAQMGRKHIFHSEHFNEFTPPEENVLKAILRANENPYGPSNLALEAFKNSAAGGNRYAWGTLRQLIEKISVNEGLEPDQIIMGPGSSDLLEKVAMVKFQKGGNVVSADPSYMSLIVVAEAVGASWKSVKLTNDYQHDLDAMEKAVDADTKLVYICNPNNPTGTVTDVDALKAFCKRVSKKVPVFVDEAYMELSDKEMDGSVVSLIAEGYDVLVARTFSKIHGMAGLRIGYLMGQNETLQSINEITRAGMGITGPSIAAAMASLDDKAFLTSCRAKITEAREYTFSHLEKRGYDYMPSQTNFVIFPIPMEGKPFLDKIYEKQVAVRAFKFWDQNWCRVSIGTLDEMKLFTRALDEVLV